MKLWLFLILAFIVQEDALMTSGIFSALHRHTSGWLIFAIFFIATIFDIWIGYKLGAVIDRKFMHGSRFQRWVRRHSAFINKPGREYLLILTGVINFPYLNGILGSWLEIQFRPLFITTLMGNLISYAIIVALSKGIISLNVNGYLSIAIIIPIGITIFYFIQKFFEKKTEKKIS